jgi:hypothetical protein
MIRKRTIRGQTALMMILLTAAALIFLAITLNWGRIAQVKSLVTIAADQGASLLASDAASYGEMEKQTYLQNSNQISSLSGIVMALIAVVVAIICLIITITTAGGGSEVGAVFAVVLAVASVIMAIVNLALQICVVQPGIEEMWNKLQKQQTIQQQFFEGGITTALQGTVTDQVNITDYFDLNTNGVFGNSPSGFPNDTVSRFAFFYTDRLRMLNKPIIPEVLFFYQQLGEFANGETCAQNESDFSIHPGGSINPYCLALGGTTCSGTALVTPPISCQTASCQTYCCNPATDTDPACQTPIPSNFQLNDTCVDSDPTITATYNPYCDPCCQPLSIKNPYYNKTPTPAPNPLQPQYNILRPSSCAPPPATPVCTPPTSTTPNPSFNPSDPSCLPGGASSGECITNNPYNAYGSYPYIYDPTFQEYENGLSFLDQYGRDQQMIPPPPGTVPPTIMSPQGNFNSGVFFPNGIFPYFWLMKDYSPEVDNINPVTTPLSATSQSLHWCAAATVAQNGALIPNFIYPPTGFPDLTQLSFPAGYYCQGQDCCVNYIPNSLTLNTASYQSSAINITSNNPTITVSITSPSSETIVAGTSVTFTVSASEAYGGPITSVTLQDTGTGKILSTMTTSPYTETSTINTAGTYNVTATASDAAGNSATSSSITITVTAAPPPPPPGP